MDQTRSWSLLAVVAAAALGVSPGLADGAATGAIDGRVTDLQGTSLGGVTVTLTGILSQRAVTGDDGRYRFGLLRPDSYVVGATLDGMGSAERAVALDAGARRGVDLVLRGESGERIEVRADAVLVNRYQIGATSTLTHDVAKYVTFGTRTYSSSVLQLPGVVRMSEIAPSLNGGAAREVGTFVDGVDTSLSRQGGELRLYIPTSSLAETRLEAAGFGAEYGRAIGGVLSSTIRSGTNRFHGEALYIGQNTKWRAAYRELDIPRSDQPIDSFEANFGGPIVRDVAWFFASYANTSDNRLDRMVTGEVIDVSRDSEPAILKLNLQPSSRHQIALTGIDAPSDAVLVGQPIPADIYGLTRIALDGELYSATWSLAAGSSTFLEVKGSTREDHQRRERFASHDLEPGASPDHPDGNNFRYVDQTTQFRWNGPALPLGLGFNDFPRDQANVTATFLTGSHELKLGLDYQDVEFGNQTNIGQEYRGRGFDRNRPGGYAAPQFKRVPLPSGVVTSASEMSAAFAQDRFDIGNRWTFSVGLRADQQTVDNDVGEQVNSFTVVAPRLSAVYDVDADGKLLMRATAGRYYRNIALDIATREFGRLPNGATVFDEYAWNPETLRYDRFLRRSAPVSDTAIQAVDPYYKDEVSAGIDWQFGESWVLGSRLLWHEIENMFWSTDQYDAQGRIYRDVRNWGGGWRDYRGMSFEVNRSFRDGWAMRTNYTLGEAEGNMDTGGDNDDLFEGLGGVERVTGRTDATSVNRGGRTAFDRTHIANLVGYKRWTLGKQDAGLGAFLSYRSGEPWGRGAVTTVTHPVSGAAITTTTFTEPRDARHLHSSFELNLTGDWTFPVRGNLRGQVGLEVTNAANEQELVEINRATGDPVPGVSAFQLPRELRLEVGVNF